MASVLIENRKRTDGSNNWQYKFETAKIGGKRKFISKSGFRTKKEALDAGVKAFAEYNKSGERFEAAEISVADFFDYWFDNYCKINLKYNTQVQYARFIESYVKPQFGHFRLFAIKPRNIQEWLNNICINSTLSKSTISNILSMMSVALDYAVEPSRMIESNPMAYVKMPKVMNTRKPKERIIIDQETFETILNRFQPNSPFYVALMIGYYTGMRIGEVFGLSWNDIDFESRTINIERIIAKRSFGVDVRKSIQIKGKKEESAAWYVCPLKTDKSRRTVLFGEALFKCLKDYKKAQLENELAYGEYYTCHYLKKEKDEKNQDTFRIVSCEKSLESTLPKIDLVCRNENGTYSSTDSFKYASRVIHHELGIDFNFHCLRHTHATRLIESNVPVKAVQERLGHSNIVTTLQTYVHNTEEMQQNAVDVFEKCTQNAHKNVCIAK